MKTAVNPNGDAYYLDTSYFNKSRDLTRAFEITNYLKPDSTGAMSEMRIMDYDCTRKLFRTRTMATYKDPMASGGVIDALREDGIGLREIPSNTAIEANFKIVCAQ